jgi:hypothetical protein
VGALATASDRMHLWSPVLVKELRTRMRGARPAWVQAGYVFAMLVVMGATYAAEVGSTGTVTATGGIRGPALGFQVGHSLYLALFIVQAVLVALIVPGLTAGAVSGEQEQKTYDMLASTRLRSCQVVLGKLLSAWLFAALLLTTSLPLAALCLLFGGVSPAELMWSYGLIAFCALFLASVGLWWSTVVARSLVAVIGAYASMGVFMIVSGIMVFDPLGPGMGYMPGPSIFAAVNPIGGIFFAANPIQVYGWSIPAGVIGALLLVLSAALLASAASQRLPLLGRRRGVVVRALMLVLFGVVTLLAMGSYGQLIRSTGASPFVPPMIPGGGRHVAATGPSAVVGPALMAGALAIFALATILMALAPVIAAGDLNEPLKGRFGAWVLGGLSPRRLLQPRVRSALAYLAVFAAVGVGIIAASLLYFAPSVPWVFWRVFLDMVGMVFATVFGCAMLGLWAAIAAPGTRGRVILAAGLVVTYLLTLLIVATAPPGPQLWSAQLAYLNPALIAFSHVDLPFYASLRALHGVTPSLGAAGTTAVLFLLIGVAGLLGAASAFRRRAVKDEASDA